MAEYKIDNLDEPNRRLRETALFAERASLPLAHASATRVLESSVFSRAIRSALGVGDVQIAGANFSHLCKNVSDVNAFIAAVEGSHRDVRPLSSGERLLKNAQDSNLTDFGSDSPKEIAQPEDIDAEGANLQTVRDYLSVSGSKSRQWTVNGNGTVTNQRDRQMWIQAPWAWTGKAASNTEESRPL